MKCILGFIALFVSVNFVFSQDDDLILGQSQKQNSAAIFDLSDPIGVNIEVNLWGFVKLPGRYRVPVTTTFLDLMSFSGGPTEESNLEEIRILRNGNDPGKKPEVIKLNYDDLMWNDEISSKTRINPVLQSGDVVIILKEKRYSFREDIGFYLPILTTALSITVLVITINK